MTTNRPMLEQKVRGVNLAHKYANELYPKLVEHFKPLVGQKVYKADGTLLKKIKDQLDTIYLPTGNELRIMRFCGPYDIHYEVQTIISHNGRALYHSANVYVVHVQDGVIDRIADPYERKTDYTADTVIADRKALEEAEEAVREIQSRLNHFSKYEC